MIYYSRCKFPKIFIWLIYGRFPLNVVLCLLFQNVKKDRIIFVSTCITEWKTSYSDLLLVRYDWYQWLLTLIVESPFKTSYVLILDMCAIWINSNLFPSSSQSADSITLLLKPSCSRIIHLVAFDRCSRLFKHGRQWNSWLDSNSRRGKRCPRFDEATSKKELNVRTFAAISNCFFSVCESTRRHARGGAPRGGSLSRFISGLRCTQKTWISGWKCVR